MNTKSLLYPFSNFRSVASINCDIDDEIQFHIECRTDELIGEGLDPSEASHQASREFGSVDKIKKQCQRVQYGWRVWLNRVAIGSLLACIVAIGFLILQMNQMAHANLALEKALQAREAAMAEMQLNLSSALPATTPPIAPKEGISGTVMDADGEPIEGARVVLVAKTWPNNRFRMKAYKATTDENGEYKFRGLFKKGETCEFKVSVLAAGYEMEGDYLENDNGQPLDPIDFKLYEAVKKQIEIVGIDGKPVEKIKIFPVERKTSNGESYTLYENSSKFASFSPTEGKVDLSYFADGDEVTFLLYQGKKNRQLKLVIDDSPVQTISFGVPGVRGKLVSPEGSPVAGAKVCLMSKTWPNGKFSMDTAVTKTNEDGEFLFREVHQMGEQAEVLVSVFADGWKMESQYIENPDGEILDSIDMTLEKAIEKTFVINGYSGKPMKRVPVFLKSRTADGQDQDFIYPASSSDVDVKADTDGKVKLNFLGEGDIAVIGVTTRDGNQSVEIEITGEPVQVIELKKKVARRRGR